MGSCAQRSQICYAFSVIITLAIIVDSSESSTGCAYQCKNGGTCIKDYCECPSNYRGTFCQVVICHAPKVLNSQHIVLQTGLRAYGGYTRGSVIWYTCKSGFRIVGKNYLSCTSAGTFTRPAPKCIEFRNKTWETTCVNEYSMHEEIIEPEKKEANYDFQELQYPAGSLVSFDCPYGTHFEDMINTHHMIVKCQRNGTWSKKWKYCQGTFCDRHVLEHGEIIPEHDIYTENIVVKYSCHSGYNLWGNKENTCTKSGQWQSAVPECITLNVFRNRCILNSKRLKFRADSSDPSSEVPYCQHVKSADEIKAETQLNTITLITAISVAIFGILLLIVAVVAFQRRRNLHRLRRARLEAENVDNEYLDGNQGEGLINFMLPSYDEALRSKPTTAPPTFDETMRDSVIQSNDLNMAGVSDSLCQSLRSMADENVSLDGEDIIVCLHNNELPPPYDSSVSSSDSNLIPDISDETRLV